MRAAGARIHRLHYLNIRWRRADSENFDVGDHDVRGMDAVARHETVLVKEPLQFPAEEEVDPDQQDRRHAPDTSTLCGRR